MNPPPPPSPLLPNMHSSIPPHACARTHTHVCMYACTHMHAHTHITLRNEPPTPTQPPPPQHAFIHPSSRMCAHTHTHTHTHTHIHTHTNTNKQNRTHTHAHTHKHTHTHTHIHIHTHTHTHTCSKFPTYLISHYYHQREQACPHLHHHHHHRHRHQSLSNGHGEKRTGSKACWESQVAEAGRGRWPWDREDRRPRRESRGIVASAQSPPLPTLLVHTVWGRIKIKNERDFLKRYICLSIYLYLNV